MAPQHWRTVSLKSELFKNKTILIFCQVVKKHLTEEHPDIRLHSSGSVKLFRLCVSDEHWVASSSYKVNFIGFDQVHIGPVILSGEAKNIFSKVAITLGWILNT